LKASEAAPTRKRLRSPIDSQRSEFLRRCRNRVDPSDLGLPPSRRKRTIGLRREDVAALSGVSVSWYTWLEQGRDMRVSDEVLERLSVALRLSPDERVYLFSLVQHRAPRTQEGEPEEAPADVVRLIQSLGIPAVAMNLRWDILAWNPLSAAIYGDYGKLPTTERNLLHLVLVRPLQHNSSVESERMARHLIARLRFDYIQQGEDPRFEALIRRLEATSPVFRRLWDVPEFSLRALGLFNFKSARYGDVTFEHVSVIPDGHPGIRIGTSVPASPQARRAIAHACAELLEAE
jgi:transcriptional regulator with XRE-family HTH domain